MKQLQRSFFIEIFDVLVPVFPIQCLSHRLFLLRVKLAIAAQHEVETSLS